MSRTYNAFLIRHWSLDDERGDRIEVVHVQSGDRSLVTSLGQAATWMQALAVPGESATHPAPADPAPDAPQPGSAQRRGCPLP